MTRGAPRSVRARGSGKLILAGEHAVVHGQPALAFAVDRGTTVTLSDTDGPTVVDPTLGDGRVHDAVEAAVGAHGVHVAITSTLPIGRGMGSSASLAVALARAAAAWHGTPTDPDTLWDAAMAVERRFHGTPSGVDVACALRGGVLRYLKGPPPTFTALPAPTAWSMVVLDSGDVGDTGALVAGVTARRSGIDPLLDRIGALVDDAVAALDDPDRLGPILDANHALLQQIGVSTPRLDALADLARRAGAHGAKLSGAGGGGVVIALVTDPAPVLAAASAAGVAAFPVRPAPGAPT